MKQRHSRETHAIRGAVLVETALVVGVILTMLLFSIQVGVLGFLQITVDAASFVDAHLISAGVAPSMTPEQATHGIFPQIAPAQIVSTVAPAPSPSVPVDYGYNSTDAATQAASANNRNGGVSMMEPTLATATVAKRGILSLFGKAVGVTGQSIDALWLECGIHANVSNTNTGCSPAGASTFQGNYFTSGENAPPYFVGFDFLHHCHDSQPWAACGSTGGDFLAIGTSEYLHAQAGSQDGNWDNALAGVGGLAGTSTFSVMACHQRAYAIVAAAIANPSYDTLYNYYDAPNSRIVGTNGNAIHSELYTGGSFPNSPNSPGTKRGINSFISLPTYTWIVNWNLNADQFVGRIYSWDNLVQAGATPGGAISVGSTPTLPANLCE